MKLAPLQRKMLGVVDRTADTPKNQPLRLELDLDNPKELGAQIGLVLIGLKDLVAAHRDACTYRVVRLVAYPPDVVQLRADYEEARRRQQAGEEMDARTIAVMGAAIAATPQIGERFVVAGGYLVPGAGDETLVLFEAGDVLARVIDDDGA
jgi:hypothetical protein